MSGIQIVLMAGVVTLFGFYALRIKSAFVTLVAVFWFTGLAIFFILFPEYTNKIAHRLGVGRGADLLFYLCILLFFFVILKLFARIRRLEGHLTMLIREKAKAEAQQTGTKNEHAPL
jgi:small membrane protein